MSVESSTIKVGDTLNVYGDQCYFGFRGYGITIAHNTREKHEVDEIFRVVQSAGGRIVKKPQDAFWGGFSGYFADPD